MTIDVFVQASALSARALETAHAERDAALDALEQLCAFVRKQGGYMKHEDQAMLRGCRALLAEHGREA